VGNIMINNNTATKNPMKRASLFNSALTNWKVSGDGQPDTWRRYHDETGEDPLVVFATIPSMGFAEAVSLPFDRPYSAIGTYRFAGDKTYNTTEARWDETLQDIVPLPFAELSHADQQRYSLWAVWHEKAIHNGYYWLPYGGGNNRRGLSHRSNQPYTVWAMWIRPENCPQLDCLWSGSQAPKWVDEPEYGKDWNLRADGEVQQIEEGIKAYPRIDLLADWTTKTIICSWDWLCPDSDDPIQGVKVHRGYKMFPYDSSGSGKAQKRMWDCVSYFRKLKGKDLEFDGSKFP
jgi:hypothetical protein